MGPPVAAAVGGGGGGCLTALPTVALLLLALCGCSKNRPRVVRGFSPPAAAAPVCSRRMQEQGSSICRRATASSHLPWGKAGSRKRRSGTAAAGESRVQGTQGTDKLLMSSLSLQSPEPWGLVVNTPSTSTLPSRLLEELREKSAEILRQQQRQQHSGSKLFPLPQDLAAEKEQQGLAAATAAATAAAVETAANTRAYEVTLHKPLGMGLLELEGGRGVLVDSVWPGGNAEMAGLRPGDHIVATSATLGGGMWEKSTVEGVVSAITSRLILADFVTVRIERLLEEDDEAAHSTSQAMSVTHRLADERSSTVVMKLERPLGIVACEREGVGFGGVGGTKAAGAAGGEGGAAAATTTTTATAAGESIGVGVFIQEMLPGGSAAMSGLLQVGDRIVAVSSTLGHRLYPTNSVEGLVSAVSTSLEGGVTMKFERGAREGRDMVVEAAAAAGAAADGRQLSVQADSGRTAFVDIVEVDSNSGTFVESATPPPQQQQQQQLSEVDARVVDALYQLARVERTEVGAAGIQRLLTEAARSKMEEGQQDVDAGWRAMDVRMYHAAIRAYSKLKRPSQILKLAHKMLSVGVQPDITMCTTLVSAFGNMKGGLENALGIHRFIRSGDIAVQPDVAFFNALMSACSKRGRVDLAERIFASEDMEAMRDLKSYNTLMDAYASSMNHDKALALFSRMRSSGLKSGFFPNKVTCTILMKALIAKGKHKEARAVLNFMQDSSSKLVAFTPDQCTWNTMILGYAQQRQPYEAHVVYEQMRSAGFRGDNATYSALIHAFEVEGENEQALHYLDVMRDLDLQPGLYVSDVISLVYTSAIAAHANMRDASGALQLVQEMRQKNIPIDSKAFSATMDACVKSQEYDLAISLYQEMPIMGLTPGVATKDTLCRAYCCAGDIAGASEVLHDMEAQSARMAAELRGKCKASLYRVPISTYNALIEVSVEQGQWDEALRHLAAMQKQGHNPSAQTVRALASCTVRPDRSIWTWDRLRSIQEEKLGQAFTLSTEQEVQQGKERLAFLLRALRQLFKYNRQVQSTLYRALLQEVVLTDKVHIGEWLLGKMEEGKFSRKTKWDWEREQVRDLEAHVKAGARGDCLDQQRLEGKPQNVHWRNRGMGRNAWRH